MRKFSFISFISLTSSLCAPSWAMEAEEGVQPRGRARITVPDGLTPEEHRQLLQDFQKGSAVQTPLDPQNTENELDLTGKTLGEWWDSGLKQTIVLKPYPRTRYNRWKDRLSLITAGVVSPSKAPDLVFFYKVSSLNLTSTLNITTNTTLRAWTQGFSHILKYAPGIKALNLSHNDITDEWVMYAYESKAFKKLHLRELNLSHNGINGSAPHILITFPELETCDLNNNKVTDSTVKKLRELFSSRSAPRNLNVFDLNNNPGVKTRNIGNKILNLRTP